MNSWNYIRRSLIHHRWIHLSVLLSVATATAVLTGALLVGDSVRGSLKELGLGRLGNIDHTLISERFFDMQRYERLTEKPEFKELVSTAAPLSVAVSTTVECTSATSTGDDTNKNRLRRATSVLLLGADERFWKLGDGTAPKIPTDGEVVLNKALADECQAVVGDKITIRLPGANPVPADSPLGRKDDRVSSLVGLKLIDIVENRGLGEFTIHPSQQAAMNAWVSIEAFADAVEQPNRINAIFVQSASDQGNAKQGNADEEIAKLDELLELDFNDFGLTLSQETRTFKDKTKKETTIWDYWHITSDRLVWEPVARDAIDLSLAADQPQELFTYLSNSITVQRDGETSDEVEIPYSIVTAADNHPQLGPLVDANGKILPPLQDDEVALNSWAAERLSAKVGDTIRIAYFAPETLHGEAEELSASFRLAAIVPIMQPNGIFQRDRPPAFGNAPTLANDPGLTPTVKGVTDQASINDWDPPFPFDQDRIDKPDEDYWDQHRTTPKAFLSLATGKRLWTSRLGGTTGFRVPAKEGVDEALMTKLLTPALRDQQTELGFKFRPLRATALEASAGTTPFEFLFLGFSMFLVASALMLIAALFRLGLDLRAKEFGTLSANGISVGKIRRLATGELSLVAIAGALLGVVGGIIYAAIMLYGLRTWWVDAIVTPFLRLHIQPRSLVLGLLLSVIAAAMVVWRGLGRLKNASPRELLAGHFPEKSTTASKAAEKENKTSKNAKPKKWLPILPTLLVLAVLIGLVGAFLSGEAQAGAFFGSGALALTAFVMAIHRWLKRSGDLPAAAIESGAAVVNLSPFRLAWRNAARYPGRSTLTIALMAAASFLILAIAAFRLAPTEAGTGGFALIANSDQPIFDDLNNLETRSELFGSDGVAVLAGVDIVRLRKRAGDDASCRNLYQSSQPQILGVSEQALAFFDEHPDQFGWAGAATDNTNRWRCLSPKKKDGSESEKPAIPVIIDKNTAMYALHLPPSIGYEFELEYEDEPVRFRIAGLLGGTTLQGNLIVHETDLLQRFPETGGYQSFLIRTDSDSGDADANAKQTAEVAALLEQRFSDEGMDVKQSSDVLSGLLAVQNTYLSTFQSLGALGLLLGAIGLVAVQVRQVISRRSELALMSAMGMSPGWIRGQLIRENGVLLIAGLGSGILAAAVALIPHQLLGAASFPLGALLATFAGIFVVALLAAALASRFVASQSIIGSLRGD